MAKSTISYVALLCWTALAIRAIGGVTCDPDYSCRPLVAPGTLSGLGTVYLEYF